MTAPQNGTDGSQGTESGAAGAGDNASTEFKPITSQADFDRLIGERVSRERAKYGDYADLKAKAAKFDEAEEATKSEIQKAADAKAKAEQERDAARAEALRLRIATKHGISDEDADLFLTGKDEATLTKQAERLAGRAADRKKHGNTVRSEGNHSGNDSKVDDERQFVSQLFGAD